MSCFEEELALLMVSVVRTAWALLIGHPRVAVIIYAPAMLGVVTGYMGRGVDGCSFGGFPTPTPTASYEVRCVLQRSVWAG